jgi:hypothetical protein
MTAEPPPVDGSPGDSAVIVSASARLIADHQGAPALVVTDDANVYWRNLGIGGVAGTKDRLPDTGGTIMSCPVGGCPDTGPRTLIGNIVSNPYHIPAFATDGTWVYTNGDPSDAGLSLFACPVGGCAGAPTIFAQGWVGHVAAAGGHVYWLSPETPGCGAFSCPAAGCGAAPACIWALADAGPLNLQDDFVVGGGFAYWMDLYGNVSQCALPDCGTQPTALMTSILAAKSLATGGGFTYVADGNGMGFGAIYQCSAAGCSQNRPPLVSGLGTVSAIAADSSHVYWTELGDYNGQFVPGTGVVRRCPVTGCGAGPETFASNLTNPVSVTVGTSGVYWVEQGADAGTGRIWAAPND